MLGVKILIITGAIMLTGCSEAAKPSKYNEFNMRNLINARFIDNTSKKLDVSNAGLPIELRIIYLTSDEKSQITNALANGKEALNWFGSYKKASSNYPPTKDKQNAELNIDKQSREELNDRIQMTLLNSEIKDRITNLEQGIIKRNETRSYTLPNVLSPFHLDPDKQFALIIIHTENRPEKQLAKLVTIRGEENTIIPASEITIPLPSMKSYVSISNTINTNKPNKEIRIP